MSFDSRPVKLIHRLPLFTRGRGNVAQPVCSNGYEVADVLYEALSENMQFDIAEFYDRMENEAQTSTEFCASMMTLIQWLQERLSDVDLSELMKLGFESDSGMAGKWLHKLLSERPADFDTRALYFGISEEYVILDEETDELGGEYANLYLVLFSEYDSGDEEMAWIYGNERFDFEDAKANLAALEKIGLICNEDGGPGTDVYIALSVAFCVLLVKHLMRDAIQLAASRPVGVVTGFSSGDLFKVGELDSTSAHA